MHAKWCDLCVCSVLVDFVEYTHTDISNENFVFYFTYGYKYVIIDEECNIT